VLIDGGYIMSFSGATDHSKDSVILPNTPLAELLISWRPVSDRLLCARLAHTHGHIPVVKAYMPTAH